MHAVAYLVLIARLAEHCVVIEFLDLWNPIGLRAGGVIFPTPSKRFRYRCRRPWRRLQMSARLMQRAPWLQLSIDSTAVQAGCEANSALPNESVSGRLLESCRKRCRTAGRSVR